MKQERKHIKELANQLIRFLAVRENTASKKDEDEVWSRIERNMKHSRSVSFYLIRSFIAAAAVCFAVWGGYKFIYTGNQKETIKNIASILDTIPGEKESKEILLVMSEAEKIKVQDGDTVTYTQSGEVNINSKQIEAQSDKPQPQKETEQIQYNQILVPKGKRTQLLLADGSRLHINSGTRVVYPRTFAKDKREIYVEGEVFLDVKKDETTPFIVRTTSFDVEVLGTTFNINAYKDDAKAEVVLVNGAVKVKNEKKQEINLAPNQLIAINEGNMGEKQKVNALDYISWTNGLLIFNAEELHSVFNKLQRYYGEEIIYDASLKLLPMFGKLELKNSLEEVLKLITVTAPLNYEIKENKYYITRRIE